MKNEIKVSEGTAAWISARQKFLEMDDAILSAINAAEPNQELAETLQDIYQTDIVKRLSDWIDAQMMDSISTTMCAHPGANTI